MSRAELLEAHASAHKATRAAFLVAVDAAHREGAAMVAVLNAHISLPWNATVEHRPLGVRAEAQIPRIGGGTCGVLSVGWTSFGWSICATLRPPQGGERVARVDAVGDLAGGLAELRRRIRVAAAACHDERPVGLDAIAGAERAKAEESARDRAKVVSEWLEDAAHLLAMRTVAHG